MKGYPKWFFSLLNGVVSMLFLSGCLLAPTTLDTRLEWDVPWQLDGAQRVLTASLHGLLAFIMLGIVGALWSVHMRFNWRHRKHRRSGLGLAILWLLLMLTGVGIYYLGDAQASRAAAVFHLAAGMLVIFWYAWHVLLGRRQSRRPS
jgi:heme A synthase